MPNMLSAYPLQDIVREAGSRLLKDVSVDLDNRKKRTLKDRSFLLLLTVKGLYEIKAGERYLDAELARLQSAIPGVQLKVEKGTGTAFVLAGAHPVLTRQAA